jgi:hypothetical protein
MEKSLCAVLYEMELDRFEYRHPYHKIVLQRNGGTKDVIKKLKIPKTFKMEEVSKDSPDLTFKSRPEKVTKTFSSTRTHTRNFIRREKVSSFNQSFKINNEIIETMRIRGSSASLLTRKAKSNPPVALLKPSIPCGIQIKIKKLRFRSRQGRVPLDVS